MGAAPPPVAHRPSTTTEDVPRTLDEAPPPRLLGLSDQLALWGNLAISLLVLVSAGLVLAPDPGLPPLAPLAAMVAIAVGAVLGNLLLGLAAVPGAETGAPGMVLLRGLLGRRGSWAPTACNIVQLVGWTVFEIVIIAESAARLTSESLRPVYVVAGGVLATVMTIRPLGTVRGYLKRVAVWVVLASTAYLFVQVLRQPLPPFGQGSWAAFWKGADIVIALAISWAPLAADYSRHARSAGSAFWGAFAGYGVASAAFFALGVLAHLAYGAGGQTDVIGALLAIPAGGIALLVLVVDELDEAFADLYSTVVSVQNIRPRLDRRALAVGIGALATGLALVLDIVAYESFLLLIGSVFVPLIGAFAVDYYVLRRHAWDITDRARPRLRMLVPWAAGFVAYQLINPGQVPAWAGFWSAVREGLHLAPPAWLSASLASLAVAALLALAVGLPGRGAATVSAPRGP
jgi:NCS1 family nucleobase:cation symporter-1